MKWERPMFAKVFFSIATYPYDLHGRSSHACIDVYLQKQKEKKKQIFIFIVHSSRDLCLWCSLWLFIITNIIYIRKWKSIDHTSHRLSSNANLCRLWMILPLRYFWLFFFRFGECSVNNYHLVHWIICSERDWIFYIINFTMSIPLLVIAKWKEKKTHKIYAVIRTLT